MCLVLINDGDMPVAGIKSVVQLVQHHGSGCPGAEDNELSHGSSQFKENELRDVRFITEATVSNDP
jgi:hypothetical protein